MIARLSGLPLFSPWLKISLADALGQIVGQESRSNTNLHPEFTGPVCHFQISSAQLHDKFLPRDYENPVKTREIILIGMFQRNIRAGLEVGHRLHFQVMRVM